MKKHLALLLIGILIVSLSACANERPPYDYAEIENLKDNLVVYRVSKIIDRNNDYNISVNGRPICSLQNNSYFSTKIKPNTTVAATWHSATTKLVLDGGYIRIKPGRRNPESYVLSSWFSSSIAEMEGLDVISMEIVDAKVAKDEINKFRIRRDCK